MTEFDDEGQRAVLVSRAAADREADQLMSHIPRLTTCCVPVGTPADIVSSVVKESSCIVTTAG